jgi:hypothetical protein
MIYRTLLGPMYRDLQRVYSLHLVYKRIHEAGNVYCV